MIALEGGGCFTSRLMLPPTSMEELMNWIRKKIAGNGLESLNDGDVVYSKKLGSKATVIGNKRFNGLIHYRLQFERAGSTPIEKLISASGLEIEGFEKH